MNQKVACLCTLAPVNLFLCWLSLTRHRVFLDLLDMGGGGFVPPYRDGQVQGDKALMGDIDLMGGGVTLIDYIIN